MTTENPKNEEKESVMTTENPKDTTDSKEGLQKMISVKNITGKIYQHRGTIRNFMVNSTPYMVEPGSAINIPESYYNKIKNNRDPHGQVIWEKCDPSEVDASSSFRRRGYQDEEDAQKPNIDNDFLENFMTLIMEENSRETAINMISICESKVTLNHIMKELVSKSGLETKTRNNIINAIIEQINKIKIRNQKNT